MSRAPDSLGPTGAASPAGPEPVGFTSPSHGPTGPTGSTKVIALAERAQEVIDITELEPNSDLLFVGKQINPDGIITQYPNVTWWRQSVARVPATIPHLFAYLRAARERNICLIRDAPANLERQKTRRQIAGIGDRGDHGFYDIPSRLIPFDADGVKINWRDDDPEEAIRGILARLGEPYTSASCVWALSATHGLEVEGYECPTTGKKRKRWTGNIDYNRVRARITFIAERALNADEAKALTITAQAFVPELDSSIVGRVHVNYIQRPHWVGHPGRDVLGNVQTIGWIKGTHDTLAVPDDLTHTARWAKAQGHSSTIADHPDAEAAVRGIGSNGHLREHMMSATIHLLRANPIPDGVNFTKHSMDVASKLQSLIEQQHEVIDSKLRQYGRSWGEVDEYVSDTPRFVCWCLENQKTFSAKTIKLTKEERTENKLEERWRIFARVAWAVETAYCKATNPFDGVAPVTLLPAPVGGRKSTLMRAAAVQYVTEQPTKTVVILMPRHKLGDEQIALLHREHPEGDYNAAVWRGRHAWDPRVGNGREQKMCQRSEEAAAVEKAVLDVERSLCKRGRGGKAVKCPFFDTCAYQQQKQIKANIWFAAHECAVHELPTTLGDVGWVIFDESPLDAFVFGIDINDEVTLGLDTLCTLLPANRANFGGRYDDLMSARKTLYHTLDELQVPNEFYLGAAVPRKNLDPFVSTTRNSNLIHSVDMRNLTWHGKVTPKIQPNMSWKQLKIKLQEAAVNVTIKKEVILWDLIQLTQQIAAANNKAVDDAIEGVAPQGIIKTIEAVNNTKLYGRIQVHRGEKGRIIRMVGVKPLAKGWDAPTLICDATGDPELLKAIWPQLAVAKPHGWGQLPRPQSVRVFQCVNRTISKLMVAVDGKNEKETARKIAGARRLYAAVLTKALEYGGADVGVVVYKSTREWIEKNCFVPEWLKLLHWGDLTGTNALQEVRALFVIGRPLASPEDVTRQAEALFGTYVPQREYAVRHKQGRIPIVPDAAGNNCILVDVQEHPDPMGERLRRQITEGAIIQAAGRARAGLRGAGEPLDLHLWTDVPVPELGPVEPVLWSELETGPDALMLAIAGVWLKNIADAVRIFSGLFTADGLKTARAQIDSKRGGEESVFS